jgi:two-component system chemotaxis sensor kinase CheA
MDFDRQALLEVFFAEAQENLALFEHSLLDLERAPLDQEALGAAFRAVHTLKGNAVSLGFSALGRLAHAGEDVLDRLRAHTLAVEPETITLLLATADRMRESLADASAGAEAARPEHEAHVAQLASHLHGAGNAVTTHGAAPAPAAGARPGQSAASTLRVDLGKLDALLALTGELAVSRLRVENLLHAGGEAARPALDAHHDADRLHAALQELVFKLRMVPLRPTFLQHQRTVRDLAEAQGKQVRLLLEGEDVEVDTSVVELVREALTHLVRNAVDHGIETPAERAAAGKDPTGTVRLSARHDGGSVVIEAADDGAGLARATILARARERGLLRADEAPSDADVLELLFLPGFSTVEKVTGTSGRGVGMDVVRRNVERLHGNVRVESVERQGTTFTLRLPLTVAVLDALRVAVGDETYLLPMEDVSECLDLAAGPGTASAGGGVVELRGRPLPYLRLRDALGSSGAPPPREDVVVVRDERGAAGLAVDAVLGSGPAVIRPLGRFLQRVPGVAGSVILGSGEVALVLDVPALLRGARASRRVGAGVSEETGRVQPRRSSC